jgi:hypothetical protein
MKSKHLLPILAVALLMACWPHADVQAQCAMCRASVESSASDGGAGLAAGLNRGILYLMLAPYALIAFLGYAWYRHSQRYTEERRKLAETLRRAM